VVDRNGCFVKLSRSINFVPPEVYIYVYIYISLILYSFYTTSTPLLYYIYQLNTTYIILYNSLHTTGLAPVAPISQMPMLGLEAFFHHPRHGRKIPEIS